jgi:microcin C transport system permease protein
MDLISLFTLDTWIWLKNISRLDFGESFTYEEPVLNVIISKFPVSLAIWDYFTGYVLSGLYLLGVLKAVKHGTTFDHITSFILAVFYSIPDFMLAILLIVYFAGGSFFNWFPIGELYSDNYFDLFFGEKSSIAFITLYLPLICYMIGSFTVLTMLMKNSLLDEVKKDYIRTARAKGVLRNLFI